jgi:TusA-related sulfurtransferase
MQDVRLQQFLIDISLDPVKYASYMRDPDAAMDAAGLTVEARSALRSADEGAILTCLSDKPGEGSARRQRAAAKGPKCPGPLELFQPLR